MNWCEEFKRLSIGERRKEVMNKKLCLNCLNPGHQAEACRSSTCKKCNERHNTLLHPDNKPSTESKDEPAKSIIAFVADSEKADSILSIHCAQNTQAQVILSTAQVLINDVEGNPIACRALLDPGSQLHFVTAKLTRKLKLPYNNETRPISGINQTKTNVRKEVQV